MKKCIVSIIIAISSLPLYAGMMKGTEITSETGPKASELYTKESGIFEIKNYTGDNFAVQIIDANDKPILKKIYTVPAAKGSKQEQLGYLRIKTDSSVVKNPLTILLYQDYEGDEPKIIKGDIKSVSLVGNFKVEGKGTTRQRVLVSVEKPKGAKLTMRAQSAALKGLSSVTTSGIPVKNNVKEIFGNYAL